MTAVSNWRLRFLYMGVAKNGEREERVVQHFAAGTFKAMEPSQVSTLMHYIETSACWHGGLDNICFSRHVVKVEDFVFCPRLNGIELQK